MLGVNRSMMAASHRCQVAPRALGRANTSVRVCTSNYKLSANGCHRAQQPGRHVACSSQVCCMWLGVYQQTCMVCALMCMMHAAWTRHCRLQATSVPTFYGRTKELKYLNYGLESRPSSITVLSGPSNCGISVSCAGSAHTWLAHSIGFVRCLHSAHDAMHVTAQPLQSSSTMPSSLSALWSDDPSTRAHVSQYAGLAITACDPSSMPHLPVQALLRELARRTRQPDQVLVINLRTVNTADV